MTRTRKVAFSMAIVLLAACTSKPPALEVTLQASEFRYEPAIIQAQVGQDVTVTLANGGTLEHDFVILEIPIAQSTEETTGATELGVGPLAVDPDVQMATMPGLNAHVTFTPSLAGTYEFYCAVPGHREAGMVGSLTVVER